MGERQYDIIMRTPMGTKHGTLCIGRKDGFLNGTMKILGHAGPVSGTIDENGECRISGRLVTLMRTLDFTAVGSIGRDSVRLTLRTGRNSFEVTGILSREKSGEAKAVPVKK